ncbi:MAG: hypothetical protein JWP81_3510 [Ferruginibacter sp.]|nr:hypothetical protein [Ferruginibacter sp.]
MSNISCYPPFINYLDLLIWSERHNKQLSCSMARHALESNQPIF